MSLISEAKYACSVLDLSQLANLKKQKFIKDLMGSKEFCWNYSHTQKPTINNAKLFAVTHTLCSSAVENMSMLNLLLEP